MRNGLAIEADALRSMSGKDLRVVVEPGQTRSGRSFTRTTYVDAHASTQVERWILSGAGHAWAGGSAAGSFTDPDGVDASAEMVRFFGA